MNSRTTVERTSDRELVATRTLDGPARIVFEAWTKPELIMRWWAPKSFGISFLACEADVRTGGAHVPFRVRSRRLGTAHGLCRPVHRSHATLPPRLDQ